MDGINDSVNMSLSKLWKIVKDKQARHVAVHGVAKSRTQLSTEQQPPMVTLWVLEAIFHCWHKITVTTIAAATITIIYIYDEAGTVLIPSTQLTNALLNLSCVAGLDH